MHGPPTVRVPGHGFVRLSPADHLRLRSLKRRRVSDHGKISVPRLSEFFGISIYMYWGDHGPPHFHARYSGHKASVTIEELSLLAGSLPPRALGLVMEWAALHQEELRAAWKKAAKNEPTGTIRPLE